jgi:hypothetical protein
MIKQGKPDEYRKPAKEFWNKHSLQGLSLKKFIEVANKLLKGEYKFLK